MATHTLLPQNPILTEENSEKIAQNINLCFTVVDIPLSYTYMHCFSDVMENWFLSNSFI